MSFRISKQIFILVVLYSSISITVTANTDLTELKSDIAFPASLAKAINPISFPSFLIGAASEAMTFVKVIVSSVDVILKLTGQKSKDYQEIRSLHDEIAKRLDEVNLQLKDIQMQIEWSQVVAELGSVEQDINANYIRLLSIFSTTSDMKESAKDDFLAGYKISCVNCAMKLFQEISGHDKLINGDLFRKVGPVLKNDRHKMQTLMIGIIHLLIKGICAELLYDQLIHGDVYFKTNHNKWLERVRDVTSQMTLVDTEVKTKWYEQTGSDINDISFKFSAQSNQNFSSTLYNFLREKYYWRDWLVIVYKPISGTRNHENYVCGGYKRYRLHGRNIVVASVDSTEEAINTTQALESIQNIHTILTQKKNILSLFHVKTHRKLHAEDIFADLPKNCSTYASVGVIDSWVDLWYKGLPERLVHLRTSGRNSYSLHYFG